MTRYDVYGFRDLSLDQALALITESLGIPLRQRDSSYWGLYYCLTRGTVRELMLYENKVGQWSAGEGTHHAVILLVNERDDMDEIRDKLLAAPGGPDLLSSRTYPDGSR